MEKTKIGEIQKGIGLVEFFCDDKRYSNGLSFSVNGKGGCIERIDFQGNVRVLWYDGNIKINGKVIEGFSVTSEIRKSIENYMKERKEREEREEAERKENIRKNEKLTYELCHWRTFSCDESQEVFGLVPKEDHADIFKDEIADIDSTGAKLHREFWRVDSDCRGFVELNGRKFYEGDTIEYAELKKLLAPQYAEKERQKKEKQEKVEKARQEYEEKKNTAIAKAKETGKNQIIRTVGQYDGDGDKESERKFGKECGIITVYEIATPEGQIKESSSAAY